MNTYKTSKLTIRDNNGHKYIYVYYKEDNHEIRINTKFEYVKNKMTTENFYNSKMPDHEKLNGHIQEIKYVVDTYISIVSGHRPVNQQECTKYVRENKYHATKVPVETLSTLTGVSGYYDQFFEAKKTDPFIKPISLKNYQSFKNFLTDFQKYYKRQYFLFNINEDFVNKLITFSQIDLSDLEGYKSKGFLQQNTVKKRLDVLREFLYWLGKKKIANFNVRDLFKPIEKTTKEIIYLTLAEIKQLISKRNMVEGDYNKEAYDSFIFNCECGLRYQDLSNLSKSDFKKDPNGYILTKKLNKHSVKYSSTCQIPIVDPLIIEIIEKYNFEFSLKSNQEYNRTLHKLFKKLELFTETLTVKRKFINGKELEEELLRNDVITCHSCRRTMITNAFLKGYSDAQIMQMSGHLNLKTLQKYANFANDEILKQNMQKKLLELKKKKKSTKNTLG